MKLMTFSRTARTLVVCVSLLGSVSCIARRRIITRGGNNVPVVLVTAEKQSLLTRISVQYHALKSLSVTVDMVPAVGTVNKGKITEYKDVRAYILFRKPADIHLIGLYPVVRNKAFDMVSDGHQFRLYLPSQNRFIVGANEVTTPSPNKLENLRPNVFLDALLIEPVDPATETSFLEDFTDEDNAAYIVQILRKGPSGEPLLARNVWFDRVALRIVRQQRFDSSGALVMDVRYSDWQGFNGVPFPKKIDINRPKDEYGVVMTVLKVDMNQTLGDDKFQLEQPDGTERRVLGAGAGDVLPKPASQVKSVP
jgi:outer membrane lipoprotein-sorting protein